MIYDGSIGRQDSACKFDKCFVEISRNISRQDSEIITQALRQKSTNQNCYVNIFFSGIFSPYYGCHTVEESSWSRFDFVPMSLPRCYSSFDGLEIHLNVRSLVYLTLHFLSEWEVTRVFSFLLSSKHAAAKVSAGLLQQHSN